MEPLDALELCWAIRRAAALSAAASLLAAQISRGRLHPGDLDADDVLRLAERFLTWSKFRDAVDDWGPGSAAESLEPTSAGPGPGVE
jgi:hypothetical protein